MSFFACFSSIHVLSAYIGNLWIRIYPAGLPAGFNSDAEVCVLENRLYLASMPARPSPRPGVIYLSISYELRYIPLCADFGPFNLGEHFISSDSGNFISSDSGRVYWYTARSLALNVPVCNHVGGFKPCLWHTHTHIHTVAHRDTHTNICMHACMYAYIYAGMYVYM